jgi:hypothetical protein
MACNGYNHRSDCNCPFGGVFHGRGFFINRSLWQRKESYTNPNAKCPQCRVSVYFYQSPYGGKVFFDAMGPPWPKHSCTNNLNPSFYTQETLGSSKKLTQKDWLQPAVPVFLESGWFHIFCSDIQIFDVDPKVTVFYFGDKGEEKKLFSRIQRDQVDVQLPILLKRSADRKHYEISTLKAKESEPSELRFKAFVSVNDLLNFENNLRLREEVIPSKKVVPTVKSLIPFKPIKERPRLSIEVIKEIKEKNKEIKLADKKKRLEEELIRRAEKAERKAKEREEFIKNSGINIRQKSKPKVTKAQIREIKKQQQRDLQKEHALDVDRGPVKTALELAFENAKKTR